MHPRLRLDIGWSDLGSVFAPIRCDRQTLERAIEACAPSGSHAVVALSVRTLFDALLSEMPSAPVVLSGITIADMPTLVTAHGRSVRAVDLDIDTLLPTPSDVAAACAEDAGIVVLAHLYGGRSDIAPIARAVGAPGRLIVEDCAQAYDGTLTLHPQADIALYSFGPIKTATALGGAIGLFRDPELAARIRHRLAQYEPLPESWFLRRAAKFLGLKFLNIPWVFGLFLASLRMAGKDPEVVLGELARGFGAGRPIAETVRYRPPLRQLRLLERRLRTWKPRPDATHQLLERLSNSLTVPGMGAQRKLWWLAPVLTPYGDALVTGLRPKGWDATRGATSMRAIAEDAVHTTPNAAHIIANVVYVPKPRNDDQAESLAKEVEAVIEVHATSTTKGARIAAHPRPRPFRAPT